MIATTPASPNCTTFRAGHRTEGLNAAPEVFGAPLGPVTEFELKFQVDAAHQAAVEAAVARGRSHRSICVPATTTPRTARWPRSTSCCGCARKAARGSRPPRPPGRAGSSASNTTWKCHQVRPATRRCRGSTGITERRSANGSPRPCAGPATTPPSRAGAPVRHRRLAHHARDAQRRCAGRTGLRPRPVRAGDRTIRCANSRSSSSTAVRRRCSNWPAAGARATALARHRVQVGARRATGRRARAWPAGQGRGAADWRPMPGGPEVFARCWTACLNQILPNASEVAAGQPRRRACAPAARRHPAPAHRAARVWRTSRRASTRPGSRCWPRPSARSAGSATAST